MHLQHDEEVVRVFHHHLVPLIFKVVQILLISVPFYLVVFFSQSVLGRGGTALVFTGIAFAFGLIALYHALFYLLDRIVVTNHRILHVDWKGAFRRAEHEAFLNDIQDITTREAGIFSLVPIFDFGTFMLETAAANTTIVFHNAPDPEGMKHFIYHMDVKPNRIGVVRKAPLHDQTTAPQNQSAERGAASTAGSGRHSG